MPIAFRIHHAAPLALVAALACPAALAQSPQQLPTTTLSAGMHQVVAQLARSPREREIGLMWRKEMAQHEGMLFIFEEPAVQCFWMRNTYLPLSVAFVADDGRIVNVVDMQPLSLASQCSTAPVRYVLEMNQGWFAKRSIKAGAKLQGAPFNRR